VGKYILPDSPPPPRRPEADPEDWTPYPDRIGFKLTEFLYCRQQMSASNIDTLLDLWAANLFQHDDHPPYTNHNHLYETIDATPLGDVPWQSFIMKYNGNLPEGPLPTWMTDEFQVWFRDPRTVVCNMLANPEFDGEIDYSPYRDFNANGERQYQDFMSGDWAWKHTVSQLEIDLTSHTHSFKDIITDDVR
jgi:Plavaka transposase